VETIDSASPCQVVRGAQSAPIGRHDALPVGVNNTMCCRASTEVRIGAQIAEVEGHHLDLKWLRRCPLALCVKGVAARSGNCLDTHRAVSGLRGYHRRHYVTLLLIMPLPEGVCFNSSRHPKHLCRAD